MLTVNAFTPQRNKLKEQILNSAPYYVVLNRLFMPSAQPTKFSAGLVQCDILHWVWSAKFKDLILQSFDDNN